MGGVAGSQLGFRPVPVYRLPVGNRARERLGGLRDDGDERLLVLLGQNAFWFCRLRWVVVGALTWVGVAAMFSRELVWLGVAVHPGWAFGTAVTLGVLNLVFMRAAGRLGLAPRTWGGGRWQLWVQISADLLVLTVFLWGLGGGVVSTRFMYLFHIVLACIVFPARESLAVVALAAALQLPWLFVRSTEGLGDGLAVGAMAGGDRTFQETLGMVLIWVAIWYLVSELSRRLRLRDRELALTNRRLEASLEERTSHMLQTTHQLKAPFAAIHAHAQLLLGGYCGELTEAGRQAVEKIAGRCLALSRQIQEMLQLANLRSKGQDTLRRETVDLAAMVEAAVARIEPTARQRGITLKMRLRVLRVNAARDHLTMLLDNLLVNAVSYSFDHGLVSVFCRAGRNQAGVVSVRDHGIGIPEDKLPRIFEDYFRTDQAARHNRASTGLGLAIVRQVADQCGISIQVRSAPGWGSRFTAFLPVDSGFDQRLNPNIKSPHGLSIDR